MTSQDEFDLGDDLEITKTTKRNVGGTWVNGTLNGHRFEALIYPEHAEIAEYQYADSRISKLWVQRTADRREVFCWDRGSVLPATDEVAAAVVDFLAAGLAEHIFGT